MGLIVCSSFELRNGSFESRNGPIRNLQGTVFQRLIGLNLKPILKDAVTYRGNTGSEYSTEYSTLHHKLWHNQIMNRNKV